METDHRPRVCRADYDYHRVITLWPIDAQDRGALALEPITFKISNRMVVDLIIALLKESDNKFFAALAMLIEDRLGV